MVEDELEKTEMPTARRLAEAKEKGIVAKSRELTTAGYLIASIVFFFFYAEAMWVQLQTTALGIWNNLYYPYTDIDTMTHWLRLGMLYYWKILIFWMAGLFISGVLLNFIQTGFVFSWYPLKPRFTHLNIFSAENYRKYFNTQMAVKLIFGFTNVFLVLYFTWKVISNVLTTIHDVSWVTAHKVVIYFFEDAIFLGFLLSGVYFILSLLDLLFQKWKYVQDLKMTKREVKDEMKQAEGGIQWRTKIQEFKFTLNERRLGYAIPKVDVILTNKLNNQAVALKYDAKRMLAPICVVLGSHSRAKQIMTLGVQHHIPLIENVRLTRLLMEEAKEGKAIPPNFYYDIANILVSIRKGK